MPKGSPFPIPMLLNWMADLSLIKARTAADIAAVKALFLEYIDFIEGFLGQSLAFQGTDTEFETFPAAYDFLLLARIDDKPAAACGVKPFRGDICELKRLYCRPDARGHNLGERLTKLSLSEAKKAGYRHIYLDTDRALQHANRLYERLGFKDIDQYYDNPMGCSRYMARAL